ncbi:MAG: thiamine pyrophosphate-binding protein, partial [Shewanella sp.]
MQPGQMIRGADAVIKVLAAHGVTTVFGYPGGAIMPIYDALYGSSVEHLLSRHEQGAAFAAVGYARASGKTGVCFATSGPGATNLITSLADALLDSVPLVAITGQVSTAVIGTDAFQEIDVLGMSLSCTKHSFMVTDVNDLIPTLYQAFEIAASGRPGPVLVDIPKDIQIAQLEYRTPLLAVTTEPQAEVSDIDAARALLAEAKQPMLYVGGGVGMAGAVEQLREFINVTGIPSVATLKGLGSIAHGTPGYLGMLGMHGGKAANLAVQGCDLLIVVGARFDDRVTGRLASFADKAKVIHLDIDAAELGKLRRPEVAIAGDLRQILPALTM